MKSFLFIFLLNGINITYAQVIDSLGSTTEQQLENITENNEDLETEDDSYLQDLVQFQKNLLNLNTADEASLIELKLLSPIQIRNLLAYRELLGKLISIYELQAIPTWDIQTISKLRPYVTVSTVLSLKSTLSQRFRDGEHTLLFRSSQVAEASRGYLIDSSVANNYYMGSPQRLMVRYKYNYKNLLQYGVLGEKDPGEQFFKGGQRKGFDFYTAHLFLRNLGIVKSLALGDYAVNLGQGLTQWQSLAFKKGPDVLTSKRQSAVLRPYSSAGEINFHRGIGVTLGNKNWETTFFASLKRVDANFVVDSSQNYEEFISSLQVSGYHRTKSESADKNIQRQFAFGGNISYTVKNLQFGLNGIQYLFKYPLKKNDLAYNRLALTGKSFGNYSFDYGYTLRNMHFFGEAAVTDKKCLAVVNGLLISTAASIDMSLFYRNISPGYQSLYTNAFTESTFPTNEKGLFAGISIKPNSLWQVSAYTDMYKFPGLRFRVNAPSAGSDYLVQVQYKPNKQFEAYTRFKKESKGINFNPDEVAISPVINQPRQNWRTQVSYKLNTSLTLRNRVEIVWFDKSSGISEQGFMIYQDILYKPQLSPIAGNIRLMYFETDGYNSRVYAFENDVLYSYASPVFYEKGYRYYINLSYDLTQKLKAWVKVAQTYYFDRMSIGSGLDEIPGNHKTEVKLQLLFNF